MSRVNVEPEIVDAFAGQLMDMALRIHQSVTGTRSAAGVIQRQIEDEVHRRRRRVEELSEQCDARAHRHDDAQDSLPRLLVQAQRRLEEATRALAIANQAIVEYSDHADATLGKLDQFASSGRLTLQRLKQKLDDYSAFLLLVPAALLDADYPRVLPEPAKTDTNAELSSPLGIRRSLSQTNQRYHSVMSGDRALLVFDHPKQSAQRAVFNQGSAFPNQIEGTCGVCAIGSLLRLAGLVAAEKGVTEFAVRNGLCETGAENSGRNGATSGADLVAIMKGIAGIKAEAKVGEPLENLAHEVEAGRGVIVGVIARELNQQWYAGPRTAAHWIVLQSVVRDATTREIVGFYIFDSNGWSPESTSQLIPKARLDRAHAKWFSQSVVTTDILW